MDVKRRRFIQSLAALAGVATMPAEIFKLATKETPTLFKGELGVFNGVTFYETLGEPVKWVVEEFDYGNVLSVCALWNNGIRNAIQIEHMRITKFSKKQMIEDSKSVLRQWYVEKHQGKSNA